jgi:transcriptional regulator of nitric oxide reductase
MKIAVLAVLVGFGVLPMGGPQAGNDPALDAQLRQVFPAATSFSPKQTRPLSHFVAYDGDQVAGYAFWTTELEPLERGYDGPIKMLVGVNVDAKLTGVLVTEHREPYGYFSVDLPEFSGQFPGKDIRDPFRVGEDVDGVTRATITITSSSRAIRNGARRVARALMTPPETR